MSDKRVTAKDVLRACITWKTAVIAGGIGRPELGKLYPVSANILNLFDIIQQFETQSAIDRIEKEVFDDINGDQ